MALFKKSPVKGVSWIKGIIEYKKDLGILPAEETFIDFMNEKGGIISPRIDYTRADVYGEITYNSGRDFEIFYYYEDREDEENELDEFRDVLESLNKSMEITKLSMEVILYE